MSDKSIAYAAGAIRPYGASPTRGRFANFVPASSYSGDEWCEPLNNFPSGMSGPGPAPASAPITAMQATSATTHHSRSWSGVSTQRCRALRMARNMKKKIAANIAPMVVTAATSSNVLPKTTSA